VREDELHLLLELLILGQLELKLFTQDYEAQG
jgi:hypothetical protein